MYVLEHLDSGCGVWLTEGCGAERTTPWYLFHRRSQRWQVLADQAPVTRPGDRHQQAVRRLRPGQAHHHRHHALPPARRRQPDRLTGRARFSSRQGGSGRTGQWLSRVSCLAGAMPLQRLPAPQRAGLRSPCGTATGAHQRPAHGELPAPAGTAGISIGSAHKTISRKDAKHNNGVNNGVRAHYFLI